MPLTDTAIKNAKSQAKQVKLFDGEGLVRDAMIYEVAFYSPTMNASQSLLWIDVYIENSYFN